MKKTGFSLFSFFALIGCSTVRFESYFPIANETEIPYFLYDDSSKFSKYSDTVIYNKVERIVRINNQTVPIKLFYFAPKKVSTLNQSNTYPNIPLSKFSFFFHSGDLYTSDFLDRKSNTIDGIISKVIPRIAHFNEDYIYRDGDYSKVFRFLSKENVFLKEKIYKKAVKLAISYDSKIGFITTDTIWFTKKEGIIKWSRLNGQIL